jgi:hypothetical protein
VESIMLIVSVLCFCGVHHAHCFCLVFFNEHDGLHKNTRQKQ